MRRALDIIKFLRDSEYMTKIKIFFSSKIASDDYDSYSQNYTFTNLNPITIKGYVRDISPEALVWKQYGLAEVGAKEVICDRKYRKWFEKCNKITIGGDEYTVFQNQSGGRAIINDRPMKIIKIVLSRVK